MYRIFDGDSDHGYYSFSDLSTGYSGTWCLGYEFSWVRYCLILVMTELMGLLGLGLQVPGQPEPWPSCLGRVVTWAELSRIRPIESSNQVKNTVITVQKGEKLILGKLP